MREFLQRWNITPNQQREDRRDLDNVVPSGPVRVTRDELEGALYRIDEPEKRDSWGGAPLVIRTAGWGERGIPTIDAALSHDKFWENISLPSRI